MKMQEHGASLGLGLERRSTSTQAASEDTGVIDPRRNCRISWPSDAALARVRGSHPLVPIAFSRCLLGKEHTSIAIY